jgi:hypothetical protein
MIEYNKNYKYREVCKLFNLVPCSGSQQRTQINNIKREYEVVNKNGYYNFKKKYTEEERNAKEIKGMYQKLLEGILSNLLAQQESHSLCFSMIELLTACGIINSDYKYCRYNMEESSRILDSDILELKQYMNQSYNLLSRLVKNILKNLESKSLIKFRQGYRLFKECPGYTKTYTVDMESQDESKIIKLEEESLKELGFRKLEDIYKYENRIYLFKRLTAIKCRKIFPDYDGYYKVYHLTLNKTGLSQNKENIYKELNQKIQSKLLKSEMLSQITQLKKIVDATINLARPFKIKENLKLMEKLEEE